MMTNYFLLCVFTDLRLHILWNSMRWMFQFTVVKKCEGKRMSYKLFCAHTHTQEHTTSMPKHNYTFVLLSLGRLNGEQAERGPDTYNSAWGWVQLTLHLLSILEKDLKAFTKLLGFLINLHNCSINVNPREPMKYSKLTFPLWLVLLLPSCLHDLDWKK